MADERRTIYLLTQGSYSDFHVVAAFSTRDLAQRALDAGTGDDIEDCYIDPDMSMPPEGTSHFTLEMDVEGNLTYEKLDDRFQFAGAMALNPTNIEYYDGRQAFHGSIWARDRESAIKAMNEVRVELIAKLNL
jgi:hypothetical protein